MSITSKNTASKTRYMSYEEITNLPETAYLIIRHKDSVFKFYPHQINEAFWQFLSENATITYGNDEENI
jgi:hypothetical protein